MRRAPLLSSTCVCLLATFVSIAASRGDDVPARVVAFGAYDQAIEMRRGDVRVVVCPQTGGRVLEFSLGGKQGLYLDEKERDWPGTKGAVMSAGRFDYGPELVVRPHPQIWSGAWTAEIVDSFTVRLMSAREEAAGTMLERTFSLVPASDSAGDDASYVLRCEQTIVNIGDEPLEVCHWGRSFSPGGGICLVPLGDRPSRFPSKYAMYEDSAIINVRNTDDKIRERDGFLEILAPPRKPKLGFDTYAGRLAYLMPGDLMFIKRFKTFPDRVYNEAAGLTLSVWYPTSGRIELEPIGPREILQPGGKASFTEEWQLVEFPFPAEGKQIDLQQVRELLR